jgi:hypothetical protein
MGAQGTDPLSPVALRVGAAALQRRGGVQETKEAQPMQR